MNNGTTFSIIDIAGAFETTEGKKLLYAQFVLAVIVGRGWCGFSYADLVPTAEFDFPMNGSSSVGFVLDLHIAWLRPRPNDIHSWVPHL